MKAKYKMFTDDYMLYLRLCHIYKKSLGYTYKRYRDRWKKLSQFCKHRQEIMAYDLVMEHARRFRNERVLG